ncbi:MAG: hypothetical protein A2Y25_11525 [Candidatus Melainabacteria bacterium GWF2_37_15]|nr:MAG: hypothetical protein A2Y25_11525 [Candidatus Melainabacteria bacterium GWF2_37_15]
MNKALSDINKDILKYTPSKVIGMLMNMAMVPIYTNLLLPEQYGLYNISIGILSLIAIIFSDWVGMAALRFLKEHFKTDNVKEFFSSILFLILSNLLVMYVIAFFLFNYLKSYFKVPEENLFLVLVLIIPIAFRALMFQILRAQIKPFVYTVLSIFNQFTTIGLGIYFIKYFNLNSTGILWGMLVSITLVDVIMLVFCKMFLSSSIKKISTKSLGGFYKYGVPIAASSLGMWIITQSNKFVIQYFKGSEYNGYIGVGYNVTFSILFPLFAVITLAGIPRIINRYEEGKDVSPLVSKLSGYFFVAFTPAVFLMCYFPQQLVLLLSNEKYISAAGLIPFLALSAFVYGMTEYTVIQYHLAKKTYLDMIIKISSNLAGIILLILLVKFLEEKDILWAVGVSALVSQLIYFGLTLIIRIRGIRDIVWVPPYRTLAKVITAILASYIVLFFSSEFVHSLSHTVIIQSILFVCMYACCNFVFNRVIAK